MSKAEEQARKAFPYQGGTKGMICDNSIPIYIQGYEQAEKDYIEYAQLWVDSGEVNIKSFKQFLKDRGYE